MISPGPPQDLGLLLALLARLGSAALLGGIVGFEREIHEKPAGMRTHMLVALGAALFVVGAAMAGVSSVDRVIAGIVAGIGFIGAGTIFQTADRVRGLTSAAAIWITAGLGIACGLGQYLLALVATAIAFIIIAVLRRLEDRIAK